MDMNKVILTGRITKEPELKQSGETIFCPFNIAVNGYKKGDVDFFKVTAFNNSAKFIKEYVHKGDLLLVDGSLHTNKWTYEGVEHSIVEITAQNVQLMRKKQTTSEFKKGDNSENSVQSDEIPF